MPATADTIIPSDYYDDSPLAIPPLDPTIFSDDFQLSDNNFISFDDPDDFDITFDDLFLPSDDTDDFLNSTLTSDPDSGFPIEYASDPDKDSGQGFDVASGFLNISSSSSPSPERGNLDPQSSQGCPVEHVSDPDKPSESRLGSDVASGFLNIPSPERASLDPASSQGSGNGSEGLLNYPSPCSGNSANNSINDASMDEVVVDQKVKVEELVNNSNKSLLKRKKDNGESNSESRTSKYRRSNVAAGAESGNTSSGGLKDDDDEKKKARLIRNRESAQLSRQRKKHYVEELEDKVRAMHSTIQDLNAKISYIVAENVSLRQQQMGSNGSSNGGVCPPPAMMYPGMAPMPYPWMPCPPYVLKQQGGSQVPLVPIPRLKPQQQPAAVTKPKKVEGKKSEGKTKKVASVSFLGLLFFILLFGGLVPMVNVKYGGMRDGQSGGSSYIDSRLYDQHHGRVLTVNGHANGSKYNVAVGFSGEKYGAGLGCGAGHDPNQRGSNPMPGSDEFAHNGTEPLVASLYVPRNDKLVKIDGNLIIHSVLASEKAMASRQETQTATSKETGLAVALPALPGLGTGRNNKRHPNHRQRALPSEEEYLKSKAADGKLQQWFREGLAGPLLSSGMCSEVFQFDVSAASGSGAIVPATSVRNITAEERQNATYINKGRNRRILHGLPIPLPGSSADNITKEHVGRNSDKGNSHRNSSLSSSMVVSVLVDPREAGDGDGDGVMGKKSFSRIFVVVLLDSVKYVTYSCMLPLMGSSHVVTT